MANSPVIQGARPSTASNSSRSRDKKDVTTKEGQGRKDSGTGDKDEIGEGRVAPSRPTAGKGKTSVAMEGAQVADTVVQDTIIGVGYPDDRISDVTQDSGAFRNAPVLLPERRDSTGRGEAKGLSTPRSPTKEGRGVRQGSPMEGVESTSTASVSRKAATAAIDNPVRDEPPVPPSKKIASSSNPQQQPPPPATPTTSSTSSKRKRGSVDQTHPRNELHGETVHTDHHAPSGRAHQASAPSSRNQHSHASVQSAPKREAVLPVTPTTASHQTHHRRTSSTTTASAMREHIESRPEPPPPPQTIPIATNPLEDEEEDEEPVDPNEPRYCFCNQVSYGQMVGCDDRDCAREWFHLNCVGLTHPPNKKGMFCFCRFLLVLMLTRLFSSI